MDFLAGYKTKIAGVSLIVAGLVGAALQFAKPDAPQAMPYMEAFQLVMNGLGLLGLRFAMSRAVPKA